LRSGVVAVMTFFSRFLRPFVRLPFCYRAGELLPLGNDTKTSNSSSRRRVFLVSPCSFAFICPSLAAVPSTSTSESLPTTPGVIVCLNAPEEPSLASLDVEPFDVFVVSLMPASYGPEKVGRARKAVREWRSTEDEHARARELDEDSRCVSVEKERKASDAACIFPRNQMEASASFPAM
jgi:hypothetical protein